MAAGRAPGRAHQVDHVAALHALAFRDEPLRHMAGAGLYAAAVAQLDEVAVAAAIILGAGHDAVGRGVDLGADRAGEIDAGMHGGAAAEGVGADAEAAGEGGALDGLDGWDGEGALFDLVEPLPGGKELFELGIGRGAERPDRLEWPTGSVEALRVENREEERRVRKA